MDVKRGEEEKVKQALLLDRFLAHAHNEMEQTALIIAAKRNNLSMARLLLMFKSN